MKLAQQSDNPLTHREALHLALNQYNGRKHSTIEMPPLLAEKLILSSEGFRIAGYTTRFEEEWNNTTYEDRKTKVDSLIKTRLEKFATRMVEKFNVKWPILQFSVGEIVRVRAPTWRQRKKGEPLWPYRAKIVKIIGNSQCKLMWLTCGPTENDKIGKKE